MTGRSRDAPQPLRPARRAPSGAGPPRRGGTAPPAAAEGGASLLWRRWRAKRRGRPTGMARAAGAAASASWGRGCRPRWRPWPGACRRWARRPSGGSSKVGPERGLPPARSRGSSCPGARRRPARGGPRRPAASLEEAVGPRRKARTAGGVWSALLSSPLLCCAWAGLQLSWNAFLCGKLKLRVKYSDRFSWLYSEIL